MLPLEVELTLGNGVIRIFGETISTMMDVVDVTGGEEEWMKHKGNGSVERLSLN